MATAAMPHHSQGHSGRSWKARAARHISAKPTSSRALPSEIDSMSGTTPRIASSDQAIGCSIRPTVHSAATGAAPAGNGGRPGPAAAPSAGSAARPPPSPTAHPAPCPHHPRRDPGRSSLRETHDLCQNLHRRRGVAPAAEIVITDLPTGPGPAGRSHGPASETFARQRRRSFRSGTSRALAVARLRHRRRSWKPLPHP